MSREIDDIIFLGAGASASEGAPLQGDLFKEYFKNCQYGEKGMNARLATFFANFFGIDTKQSQLDAIFFPTFEEALGLLEFSLNRGESFKGYSLTPNKPLIQQIKEDLIFLIAIILDKKLKGENKHHKQLVNRLKDEKKLLKTAFVSLNYEILIDNALSELYPHYDLDYGIEFTNFKKRNNDWRKPQEGKSVSLYKLHGSLNWLYCPTCTLLTLTPLGKRVATLVFKPQKCDSCKSEMIPIIIPPTFFKVMSNFYLQQIWRKTEDVLSRAKRLLFCGYSFPDADIHVKYLLKRIEINTNSDVEIFVINNHKGKTKYQKTNEQMRYKRFFKNGGQKVHYTELSFEAFCRRGIT